MAAAAALIGASLGAGVFLSPGTAEAGCILSGGTWNCSDTINRLRLNGTSSAFTTNNGILVGTGDVSIHLLAGSLVTNTPGNTTSDGFSTNTGGATASSLSIVNDGTVQAVSLGGSNFGGDFALNNTLGSVKIVNNGSWTGVQVGMTILSQGTVDITNNIGGLISGSITGIDISSALDATVHNWGDIRSTAPTVAGNRAILGGAENDSIYLMGGTVTGNVLTAGGADHLEWSGGTFAGSAFLGAGSDTALISATTYDGSQILDGGDDTSTADGMIDSVTFSGLTAEVAGANIVNWENVVIDGGTMSFSDGALTTGSDAGSGLFIRGGGILKAKSAFALTGNMAIDSDGTFDMAGAGAGHYSISGSLEHAGLITSQDGHAGDTLTVQGNYIGRGGRYVLDTALGGDSSASDQLVIDGDTSGSSSVRVVNAGGLGAVAANGIRIIDVLGASNGTFALEGDYAFQGAQAVVAGAYSYRLLKGGGSGATDGDWYLRSTVDPADVAAHGSVMYQPGVPVFEIYPRVLLDLNGLPTLQQRVGNRYWNDEAADAAGGAASSGRATNRLGGNGIWARAEGTHSSIDAPVSTSGSNYHDNIARYQFGLDGALYDRGEGMLVGGLTFQYGHASSDVFSYFGDGAISSDAYGLGSTLTWYGNNGFYLDGQGQITHFDSNLTSASLGELVHGNDGSGYALSLEGGQRLDLGDGLTMTPQAQLLYSSVNFDRFTQTIGQANISLVDGQNLRGRLGLTLDKEASEKAANGTLSRSHLYGIANVYYNFKDGTPVDVSSVSVENRDDRLWGGLGLGGSYNWNNDKYSVYAEASVNTSLADLSDNYGLKGNVGLRVSW